MWHGQPPQKKIRAAGREATLLERMTALVGGRSDCPNCQSGLATEPLPEPLVLPPLELDQLGDRAVAGRADLLGVRGHLVGRGGAGKGESRENSGDTEKTDHGGLQEGQK